MAVRDIFGRLFKTHLVYLQYLRKEKKIPRLEEISLKRILSDKTMDLKKKAQITKQCYVGWLLTVRQKFANLKGKSGRVDEF